MELQDGLLLALKILLGIFIYGFGGLVLAAVTRLAPALPAKQRMALVAILFCAWLGSLQVAKGFGGELIPLLLIVASVAVFLVSAFMIRGFMVSRGLLVFVPEFVTSPIMLPDMEVDQAASIGGASATDGVASMTAQGIGEGGIVYTDSSDMDVAGTTEVLKFRAIHPLTCSERDLEMLLMMTEKDTLCAEAKRLVRRRLGST